MFEKTNTFINLLKSNDKSLINLQGIEKTYGNIRTKNSSGDTILHVLAKIDSKIDTAILLHTFELLFATDININSRNALGNTFIHELIKNDNITDLELKIILYSFFINCKGFNINIFNYQSESILHMLIKYRKSDVVLEYLPILRKNNFDFMNPILCEDNLSHYIIKNTLYNDDEIYRVMSKVNIEVHLVKNNEMAKNKELQKINKSDEQDNDQNDIDKMGSILTYKHFYSEPAIDRNKEIEQIIRILATDKKSPLLIGPSGVGKTAIIDELAYFIQQNKVPFFLKNTLIFETTASRIVSDTGLRGDFEKKMYTILNFLKNKKSILFLDEIHTILGAGTGLNSKSCDMSEILKNFIDRENIKIIGATTNDEYLKYLAGNPLKRRFITVSIEEPNKESLYNILKNYLLVSANNKGISTNSIIENVDNIIKIIIDVSKTEHRKYFDKVNNPDLAISIIDDSIANQICQNTFNLNIDDFISGIDNCDKIYDSAKCEAIMNLNSLIPIKTKILKRENNIIKFSEFKH